MGEKPVAMRSFCEMLCLHKRTKKQRSCGGACFLVPDWSCFLSFFTPAQTRTLSMKQ